MDTLAHGLWGGMAAGWQRRFGLAFLFGMGPDLCSFGPYIVYQVVTGIMTMGKPAAESIPWWVYTAYDYTHSLIVIGALCLVLWFAAREIAIPFLAWPLHILCDIPTHSREFFPTPFLFPVSDYTFNGINWGQRWFMILNYSCLLAMALAWVYFRHRRRKMAGLAGKTFMARDPLAGKAQSPPADNSSKSA